MPIPLKEMSAGQRMMVEDGFPASFILSAEERAAAWRKNPPVSASRFHDPRLEASRALVAAQKKADTDKRIASMLQNLDPAKVEAKKAEKKAAQAAKGPNKVQRVEALARRNQGVTVQDICKMLECEKGPASSLISDLRRVFGEKLVKEVDADRVSRFFIRS